MTTRDRFESVNGEFLKFENIPLADRPFTSPDLCAFALLDKKFPSSDRPRDMVDAAEHDEIFLRITEDKVAQLTDDEIVYLTRCGVRYSDEYDCLTLFV